MAIVLQWRAEKMMIMDHNWQIDHSSVIFDTAVIKWF